MDYYEIFSDMTSLALYGLALGWFVGVAERSRFQWLFSRRVAILKLTPYFCATMSAST